MSFVYRGKAWDGQRWSAAAGVVALGTQVSLYEDRPTAADGTVASRVHDANSPNSDHTVKPKTGSGIVRAIDMTVARGQGIQISEAIRVNRDSRLKYLIYNERMFSSYISSRGEPAWKWRTAKGHKTHIHVSTLKSGDGNGAAWKGIGDDNTMGFSDHEVQELRDLVAALDSVDSGGEFAAPAVKLIRRERSKKLHSHGADDGGLTEDDVKAIINQSRNVAD